MPYIDLTQCDHRSEELEAFEAISSVSPFFTNNRLLAKILIVKEETDKHLIYFYAQHAVWDFLSTEVLGNLFLDKMLGIGKQVMDNAYGEYVKSRKGMEDKLKKDTHGFVDRFLHLAKNYDDATREQTIQYFLDVSYQMKPGQADEILKNPIQWGIKLFALINMDEPSQEQRTLPFILIRFSRENADHTTLGLYLDSVLQVVNTNGWTINQAENSRYSYALFELENLPKEVRNNYFSKIPAINFVTAFDPAYSFEPFGKFKMEIKKMPEIIVTKGYISIRIINDVLHLLIPSFGNERERMEAIIKGYLEQN
ncbi:hypothetical protein ABD76_16365 [Paenibacillus dendritiformis]|uniref:hypothetical protein n=1 Tax=Paenibacillus dendritiformis TaxID=130049 RepID=UPI0018CCD04B|nr:hypothetical protein [Paenibacillus dendritiformis]MBG9793993.1 hypothetical protein [Paenibacillus dendritiformis]